MFILNRQSIVSQLLRSRLIAFPVIIVLLGWASTVTAEVNLETDDTFKAAQAAYTKRTKISLHKKAAKLFSKVAARRNAR